MAISNSNISIILQGPVKESDIGLLQAGSMHYKNEFPGATLIIAISPLSSQTDEQLNSLKSILSQMADKVVIAQRCSPQSPIKLGIGPNNFNQQRATARAALDNVETKYTLRLRNDMLSVKRSIIDSYDIRAQRKRGRYSILNQRVVISQFFSLNPFTTERLPFHFSDWINFGLTIDVKDIWSIPEYPQADTKYYSPHPSVIYGLDEKIKFLSRIAVEQHLYFSILNKKHSEIKLNNHSDETFVNESIDFLVDNFIIDDAKSSNAIPDKYKHLLHDETIKTTCITPQDWEALVDRPQSIRVNDVLTSNKLSLQEFKARDIFARKVAQGTLNKYAASILIKLAYLCSNKKSRKKLLENPNTFFFDMRKYPSKYVADIYMRVMKK